MRRLVIPVLATVLTVALMSFQAKTVYPVLCDAPEVRLPELAGFAFEPVPPGEAELETLPKDTRIDKRNYLASDGQWFLVSAVTGGESKSSIHRPELCLPGQGFQMTEPRTRRVDGIDWRFITLTQGDAKLGFAYTFFNQDGFRTSSHVRRIFQDVLDRSFKGRIDRWVMVTVNSSVTDERRLSSFLAGLKGVMGK